LRPINLNQEIKHVEALLRKMIPKMIDIKLHLDEKLNIMNADSAQIEQVMMNLWINARDAMPAGGKLIITTENVSLDREFCKAHLDAIPGKFILLSVSDTGTGMDKETMEHIFEPFFTTKETGRGTGLGLAMVYGIVRNHGGLITCHSEPGEGTGFKIYFPAISSVTEKYEEDPNGAEETAPGTETILLVDDEALLRDLGEQILSRFGYTVLKSSDGESALEEYHRKKGAISLVILDLIMPGMGGVRCLEELRRIDPEVKVIITSGYSINKHMERVIREGAKGFIGKPYKSASCLKLYGMC